jgi:hypothetical protein
MFHLEPSPRSIEEIEYTSSIDRGLWGIYIDLMKFGGSLGNFPSKLKKLVVKN